ncbi:ATP-binding cassette domain-containing protein [Hyphobacterium sp.]|uniref:ATP-binding cassette domain-containing protein n=1 Tax=Hyphobacterium sp. TaxID=2004662 RepID=UPI0037485810
MTAPAISVSHLEFAWPARPPLLSIPSFELAAREHALLIGPSGSGKSTFLGLIAGVTRPQTGEFSLFGERMDLLGPSRRDAFRADHMGVIFQLFNLLPYLSPIENVTLPTLFSAARRKTVEATGRSLREEALRLLDRLGLDGDHARKPTLELSVGQQQRVAAARALIGSPGLVIADEPTSALDHEARDAFLDLLSEECEKADAALLFVSHDQTLKARFSRSIDLREINQVKAAA